MKHWFADKPKVYKYEEIGGVWSCDKGRQGSILDNKDWEQSYEERAESKPEELSKFLNDHDSSEPVTLVID